MRSARTWFAIPVALLAAVVAACAGGAPGSTGTTLGPTTDPGKPQVVIQSPPANAQVAVGQPVEVVTTGVDSVGVGQIDLRVNGLAVSSAEAPVGGQQLFSAVHTWVPSTPGPATLSAVAYRIDGAPSDEYAIAVFVLVAGSSIEPYPTYGEALPTYRAAAVPSNYVQPTYKANPTYAAGATPTYAAATPTYAAATPTYVAATPTYAAATPTYVAATPTAAPVAPPDDDFDWAIPFLVTGIELNDEVSYPAGDVEDVIDWEVTGLSQTPPQHAGRLIVFASCAGLGQQYITFQIGTAKYGCGDKIIDQLFTFDSNKSGRIRVFAFAGAYVEWTLTAQVQSAT